MSSYLFRSLSTRQCNSAIPSFLDQGNLGEVRGDEKKDYLEIRSLAVG